MNEFILERDTILSEVGELSEEDLQKAGISLEEFNNPDAEVISKLIEYVNKEYNQTPIFSR